MYGYRPIEWGVALGPGEVPDASFRVTKIRPGFYDYNRSSVRVSLGCHVAGCSLPVPDLNHGPSILAGCTKRVAAAMPPINRALLRRFKRWVKRFCERYLTSLQFSPDEQFTFEEWIENTPYADYRKVELKQVYKDSLDRKPKTKVKSFVKDENYPEPKHLRGIYSRDDDYKVRVGPYFQKFGDRLFALKWFIKKISVPQRPYALLEKLRTYNRIFCTDFSQYESTFVSELMAVEHWVYRWTLKNHPMQKHFCDLFALMRTSNKITFKNFDISLDAKRMSGEMNTSCGNGLMNLLFTFFNLERAGNDITQCDAYFEGDDGIIGCQNYPTAQMYADLGARIKIEIPDDISTASFCGNVFHPADMANVTNPSEASVAFGWTRARNYRYASDKILRRLLLAKSISMMYEYPACPILKSLAHYGIRCTYGEIDNITEKFLRSHSENLYRYQKMKESLDFIKEYGIPNLPIGDDTRSLVERLYGITVTAQLEIEKYLDSLNDIQELDIATTLNCPRDWFLNDIRYSADVLRFSNDPFFGLSGFTTPAFVSPQVVRYFNH